MNHYLNPKVSSRINAVVRVVSQHTHRSLSSVANEMLEDALQLPKYQALINAWMNDAEIKMKQAKKEQLRLKMSALLEEYISL